MHAQKASLPMARSVAIGSDGGGRHGGRAQRPHGRCSRSAGPSRTWLATRGVPAATAAATALTTWRLNTDGTM